LLLTGSSAAAFSGRLKEQGYVSGVHLPRPEFVDRSEFAIETIRLLQKFQRIDQEMSRAND